MKKFELDFEYRNLFAEIPQTLFSQSLVNGNPPFFITLAYNTGYNTVAKPKSEQAKPQVAPFISYELARKTLKEFHGRLDRELVGSRFNTKNPYLFRTFFIAVLESHALRTKKDGLGSLQNVAGMGISSGERYRSTSPHWHLIAVPPLKMKPSCFQSLVRQQWDATWHNGKGSVDVQKIESAEDLKRVSGYVAKHIHYSTNNEKWTFSTEFVNSKLLEKYSVNSLIQTDEKNQ